ncbi:fused histidine kinase with GAF domain/response regulator receiver [Rivularia sp. PCC 7116]|uniref:hybrid sensor histidine kinase/response regulator n=1 Tax=Rivularia sp. PCC 7116 TaxID=373994 RepID=UPI00029EEEFA|nr:response regulator [Rivularia sp. PCC 7116]AFY55000.1 fused histidine kinase with GAF domain/response regulator receiver [Rivularia sp. PCC 7116]
MRHHQQLLSKSTKTLAKLIASSLGESSEEQNFHGEQEKFYRKGDNFVAKFQDNRATVEVNPQEKNSEVILIVDDTPENLLVLFSFLEEKGFKVLLAEDGESALQIAQSKAPDLILLDVLMPEIDGFETCRRLKEKPYTKEIPVIFLTALSETVNKVQGFKLGGVDYITKPSEQEEVLVRIQTHLNLQRMRSTLAKQNQELKQRLDFQALQRRITDKLRDSLNESQILQTATQELAEVLELGSCQIELYDSQQVTATIAYEHSITLPQSQGTSRNIKDFSELYQQLLEKIPVQLVEKIPQFSPQQIQVTRLACPIFDERGIIGNVWALKPPTEVFTDLEIELMQQVASQCAIAIRQARLYEASNHQVAELARLNQLKDDFLKTITHELKAPLSSIHLAAETMDALLATDTNPHKSSTFKRVIKIFHDSYKRQKQLIDDLLTLCYVDATSNNVKLQSINLHLWIPDLVQLYLARTKDQQQQLILDLAEEELQISTDPIMLERIIKELLHNAYKYTPSGEKITIQTEADTSNISLRVINTGVEIPVEQQELIFNQFYRIPNSDPWKYGGTGLGLALVKKLAEMLEATVDVESRNGMVIFCIRFPIRE